MVVDAPDLAHRNAQERLNQMGQQGWELVSVVVVPLGVGTSAEASCVFKREMPPEDEQA